MQKSNAVKPLFIRVRKKHQDSHAMQRNLESRSQLNTPILSTYTKTTPVTSEFPPTFRALTPTLHKGSMRR